MTPEEKNNKILGSIGRKIRDHTFRIDEIPYSIEKIIDKGIWKKFKIYTGKIVEHKHFYTFVTQDEPQGWGFRPQKIEALIKDEPRVLAKWREVMKQPEGGDKRSKGAITCNNITGDKGSKGAITCNNITGDKGSKGAITCNNITGDKAITGTTKAYTLSRLEREAPELFERVCNKELSANAAAIKAGFRQTRTVYLSKNPAAAAQKITEIADAEYIAKLVACLKNKSPQN